MIRVRFHGRGGHGVKTASRILGTAAFLAGYQVQDSPIYGAERRGAAVMAFTRIAERRILERGPIEVPDLVLVADETLVQDSSAGVTLGLAEARAVFVNAAAPGELVSMIGPETSLQFWDLTQRSLERFGRVTALSAGLAAAAARICNRIALWQLEEAISEELQSLGLATDVCASNLSIAREVFGAVRPVPLPDRQITVAAGGVWLSKYEGAVRGAPSILSPGNAVQRKTGSWRIERPRIRHDACTRCGLCLVQCPDGTIALDAEGYPVIDYDHCKGCMICREICPVHAIASEREGHVW